MLDLSKSSLTDRKVLVFTPQGVCDKIPMATVVVLLIIQHDFKQCDHHGECIYANTC